MRPAKWEKCANLIPPQDEKLIHDLIARLVNPLRVIEETWDILPYKMDTSNRILQDHRNALP